MCLKWSAKAWPESGVASTGFARTLWEIACDGGLIADQSLAGVPIYCRSWLASEGGLTADLYFVGRVHIRCCGNGGLWFRPYGESLLANAPKGTKRSRPERPAPRLGSAFLRCGIHPGALPSGLLRYDLHAMCAAAPHGAARQSPDEHLHSASRWRRAHGAGPERGHAEPRRGTERKGQKPFGDFGAFPK